VIGGYAQDPSDILNFGAIVDVETIDLSGKGEECSEVSPYPINQYGSAAVYYL